jgi:hypothetical protein
MPVLVGAAVAVAIAGAAIYLRGLERVRTPAAQAELEHAVASVDRELAADLELLSLFDQTRQPLVLENAQFLAARSVIEREAPEAYPFIADLYERIPATEASMERRGPAGSFPDEDRMRVNEWEGDAREAQRLLRGAARPVRRSRWQRLTERLRRH